MKYGKYMQELKVSEWDSQYLDYKAGKREIKKLCNTIPTAERTSRRNNRHLSTLLQRSRTRAGFRKIPEQEQDQDAYVDTRPKKLTEQNTEYRSPVPKTPKSPQIQITIPENETQQMSKSPRTPRSPLVHASTPQDTIPEEQEYEPKPRPLKKTRTFVPVPLMKRLTGFGGKAPVAPGISSETVSAAQAEAQSLFTEWLAKEMDKVDKFYTQKETEALKRFRALEEQLMIMRDRTSHSSYSFNLGGTELVFRKRMTDDMEMDTLPHDDGKKDYERKYRKPMNAPTVQAVRARLKHACVEYYRRLEFLRSYVVVNKEGFRKLCKKFDKHSGMRTQSSFMNQKVGKSYFGGMDTKLEPLTNDTELLVAKFFYGSDRRRAAKRLRTSGNKTVHNSALLQSGLFLGASFIIGDYAVFESIKQMSDPDEVLAQKTRYVMELWSGIALMLLQALLFALNLRGWARNKINYAFIFEFDPRNYLNHRQFLLIPSFLIFTFIICMWFSVHDFWRDKLDLIHFPIIYLAFVAAGLFNPFDMLFRKARLYFLNCLWRLALSGFYHVEFKDFWLGDMLSSQAYAFSNTYLFFCLYSRAWNDPEKCSSDAVKPWGIIGALPAFWRFVQCFRRWKDSGHWFPHLANAGKYTFVIGYYVTLNIWRTEKDNLLLKSAFIGVAVVNTCFGLFWDVVMDWSLLNPYAPHPLLRNVLFFRRAWAYYFGIVADVVLRCTWVLYVVLEGKVERRYSPLISFGVAAGEIFRRFIWCFFRMENEHAGNVENHRAYKDPKLPYRFKEGDELAHDGDDELKQSLLQPEISGKDDEEHRLSSSVRIEQDGGAAATLYRLGRTLSRAHMRDYERKKKPHEGEIEEEDEE